MLADGRSGSGEGSLVPASDAAGEVLEVGAAVQSLRPGDRVTSSFFPDWEHGPAQAQATARALGGSMDGVLAEQVVLPERAWVPMPAHLSFVEAATLPCAGLTAWHALNGLEPLPPVATIVVLGSGGVSVFALQLATAAGHRVILTSADNDKRERARALGAFATINYRKTPEWDQAVRALTNGRGADLVLDTAGPATLPQSIAALRDGGTVAVIGRLAGSAPAQVEPAALFSGQKRLAGLMVGSRAMAMELARFMEAHALRPVVDRVFPFTEVRDAYAYLASGKHLGKVVVEGAPD
jgi:NADPH:quinone reductase-like Zn-dependent oxidoreductase